MLVLYLTEIVLINERLGPPSSIVISFWILMNNDLKYILIRFKNDLLHLIFHFLVTKIITWEVKQFVNLPLYNSNSNILIPLPQLV